MRAWLQLLLRKPKAILPTTDKAIIVNFMQILIIPITVKSLNR